MQHDATQAEGVPVVALASGLLLGALILLFVLWRTGEEAADDTAPPPGASSPTVDEEPPSKVEGMAHARRLTARTPRLEGPRIASGGAPGAFRLVFVVRGQQGRPTLEAVRGEGVPPGLRVLRVEGLVPAGEIVESAAAACEWTLEEVTPGPLHVELRDGEDQVLRRVHMLGSAAEEGGLAGRLEPLPEAAFTVRTIDAPGDGRLLVTVGGRMPSGGWRVPGRSVRRTAGGYEALVQLAPPDNPADAVMTPMEIGLELSHVPKGPLVLTVFTLVLPRGATAPARMALNDQIWTKEDLRVRTLPLEGLDG